MKGTSFMRRANITSGGVSNVSGSSSVSDELPTGWKMMTSRSTGQVYYLHIQSGKTQWDKPGDSKAPTNDTSKFPSRNVIASGVSLVGAGLTSMFSSANNRFHSSSNLTRSSAGATNGRISSSDNDRDGQICEQVYENERVGAELLPTDPKRFDDGMAKPNSGYDEFPDICLDENWEWTTEWEVDAISSTCDKDGWCYGDSFATLVKQLEDDLCHATKHPNDCVRRRRYVRYRRRCDTIQESSSPKVEDVSKCTITAETCVSPQHNADESDPFKMQKTQQATGFRVPNVRFPHRSAKDNTKDYQHIELAAIEWLITADAAVTQSNESLKEDAANLEERIKEAANKCQNEESTLQKQNEQIAQEISNEQQDIRVKKEQYHTLRNKKEILEVQVEKLRQSISFLKEETEMMDSLTNKEQRALNNEMEAMNLALEEKERALITARMRYKQDTKQLTSLLQLASSRVKKNEKQGSISKETPVNAELKEKLSRIAELKAQVDTAKQQRSKLEAERRSMFKQVVDQKADIRLQSKQILDQTLYDLESQILELKTEQKKLIKNYSQSLDSSTKKQIEERRAYIRSQLSGLKEKRSNILAKKKEAS